MSVSWENKLGVGEYDKGKTHACLFFKKDHFNVLVSRLHLAANA